MNIVVIDPEARTIRLQPFPSFGAARRLLEEPVAVTDLTETHMLVHQPFACSVKASFFFSRRLEQHYAGKAFVVGATVDRRPTYCGPGVMAALKKDILFLGGVEQAKKTLASMVKFDVGTLGTSTTTH